MKKWQLRKGAEKRFTLGHPWLFSNELITSPKGVEPGEAIELHDYQGRFLAFGYGHPASLIAFRALSRSETESREPVELLQARLQRAYALRVSLALHTESHRWLHGEADGLPGLILDSYALEGGGWVFGMQAQTAGAERLAAQLPELIEIFCTERDIGRWALVEHSHARVRKLEGLALREPRVLKAKGLDEATLRSVRVRMPAMPGQSVLLEADLLEGQKTGLFLDQGFNIRLLTHLLARRWKQERPKGALRMLDLCCYAGSWSAHVAALARSFEIPFEATLVDASQAALDLAERNVKAQGGRVRALKLDVMEGLAELGKESFDIVICDPPALIKSRKEIPQGRHGYMKLNEAALRHCANGAILVSCSCSALLSEAELAETLAKAERRSRRCVQVLAHGSQGPDHPELLAFPEGRYLKALFALASEA